MYQQVLNPIQIKLLKIVLLNLRKNPFNLVFLKELRDELQNGIKAKINLLIF